jgi:hypothetical protein
MIPFAADRAIEPQMKDSYTYHLRYPQDGRQTHYYVERVNTSEIGKIDLTYTTKSNTLDVDVENLKVLWIYCRSMYEDECKKVYGIDPFDYSNYFKWYFIEKNHLNVNIDSDYKIEELKFIDTPMPYKVLVNVTEWKAGVKYNYTSDYSTAISNVPPGHTNIDIYFKPENGVPPVAELKVSKRIARIDEQIDFDASGSYDPDGTIIAHFLDFGDGTFHGGDKQSYSYSKLGTYGVILTVRDNEDLISHAYLNITVVESTNLPEIQGVVPDQIKPEDSPPWTLNLTVYEPFSFTSSVEFYWYIMGEDTSIYSVSGENSTYDQLLFTPVPDAYGSDLVTLWLVSSENISSSQPLWVNITPVNDPPTIGAIPDLIVHYDDPYIFNYLPYVNDKETPREELNLSIFDGFEEDFISISGLNATFNYPKKLVGEVIYATIMVSDGEAVAQEIITIQVTSDYVPKLVKLLPDIWLYEGTTKYNVFDLDDYFMDPDNDAIYFSYGATHLSIMINLDHTVDITADAEWSGSELVTFRARDPIGALAEDLIVITVIPVNDPPVIENVPDFIIHYDHDYRFDLTPYIHDKDNESSELTIIPSDPEHIRLDILNNLVIIINYPIEYLGQSVPVRLAVTDGLESGFQNVTITVTDDYPPELLTPLPDVVFLEDMPLVNAFDLDSYFLDVDGDVLYYTTGQKCVTITINDDHTVDFTSPKDWYGMEYVYFRATDPTGALQQDLILVSVLPVNDPPMLMPIPPQYGNESERWVLDLKPYVNDVDNNITELMIYVDDLNVIVSGNTLVFLGTKDMSDSVKLTVSDGQFESTRMIEIHVKLAKSATPITLWELFFDILPIIAIIILTVVIVALVVYRKKTSFVAEEVFLIHKGGTLINHLMRRAKANVDDVIFSGMFTAVQDFIQDTFKKDDDSGDTAGEDNWILDELKMGENRILIERSENTYLAVIFSGSGSSRLRKIVAKLLDKIETKYEKILPNWDGDIRALSGTKEILSLLIKPMNKSNKETKLKSFEKYLEAKKPKPVQSPKPAVQPIKTQPITKAIPKIETKEILENQGRESGVERPGLHAMPLKVINGRIFQPMGRFSLENKIKLKKIPFALNINASRSRTKAIAIKQTKKLSVQKPAPSELDMNKVKKPVQVSMPGFDKKFEIDPARSLLEQLAELEDMDDQSWN